MISRKRIRTKIMKLKSKNSPVVESKDKMKTQRKLGSEIKKQEISFSASDVIYAVDQSNKNSNDYQGSDINTISDL